MALPMMRVAVLILSCLCIGAASAQAPPNPCTAAECTPIFYPGLNGSQCYRIPSIIATHRGTLLAFAESRLGGCGDQGTHNLVVRRSSDNGATWGPLITVFAGVVPCPGCPAADDENAWMAIRIMEDVCPPPDPPA